MCMQSRANAKRAEDHGVTKFGLSRRPSGESTVHTHVIKNKPRPSRAIDISG